MANVISVAGAAGQGRRQREREPTAIEQIMQGLQIAKDVYGIHTDVKRNAAADAQGERQKAEDEGFLTPEKLAELSKTHAITRDPVGVANNPNTAKFKDNSGDIYATFIKPPEKKQTRQISLRTPDGGEKIQIVDDVAGQSFDSAGEKKDKPLRTEKIMTVDEDGDPITIFVDADDPKREVARYAGKKKDRPESLHVPEYGAPARQASEAKEFRNEISDTQDAIALLQDIKAEGKDVAVWDLKRKAKIQSNIQQAVGKMRLSLLGPGAMTDKEKSDLIAVIGDPAALFSTEDIENVKLDNLIGQLGQSLDRKAKQVLILPPGHRLFEGGGGAGSPTAPAPAAVPLSAEDYQRAVLEAAKRKLPQ